MTAPERSQVAPGLNVSRVITGLWQVADMERERGPLDRAEAAAALLDYARAGFDTFDMADHYGSAEDITGHLLRHLPSDVARPTVLTKWCPEPGPMTRETVRAGIGRSLERLGMGRIDLLQLHWWTYEHPGYLDALRELATMREEGSIGQLGLTNFDTDHLRLLAGHGLPVATNQVSFSLLDRRAGEALSAFCLERGTRLLTYGTLAGGFLSDHWVGRPEPERIGDWSKMKYRRFIEAIGGWGALQAVLAALAVVARRHGVSVANVATRWVLEQPAVAAVIVGARLGEREHRADNLRLFEFALDEEDRTRIDAALTQTRRIPGDCGDEYRRPPFLTASGDLSHHLASLPAVYSATPMAGRLRVDTGSVWEPLAGYSRAVRVGDRILVSGTTATHGSGEVVCPGDPYGQTVYVLDKIAASLTALGGSMADVVRTRIYVRDAAQWEPVARAHGRRFGEIRPANTLVEAKLVGGYEVEIEVEAVVG